MTNPVTEIELDKAEAELSKDGSRVLVTFKYDPALVSQVKKVPSARFVPATKPEGPAWRLDKDLATMRQLREKLGDRLTLGDRLKEWGLEAVKAERNLKDLSQADDAELESPALERLVKGTKLSARIGGNGKKRFKLRPYQKADIRFMANSNVINANQPGAGKTIELVAGLVEAGMEWGQHLVFSPVSSLRAVWENEIKAYYEMMDLEEPIVLTGDTPAERREAVAEAVELAKEDVAFYLVLNPYMARMKRVKVEGSDKKSPDEIEYEDELVTPELIGVDWDSVSNDEFHLSGLSNPNTAFHRGLMFIAEATQPTKRFALSGTPMGGKPIKLWGALHFLDPERFTSRWNWARHWLVITDNGYGSSIEGIMPGREVEFYEHLKPYLVRRTKREALPGLPPKQIINVWCDMTPRQREQYVTFATEAEWRIEDAEGEGRLSATNVLAEYTRLKQFAGAFCDVTRTGREKSDGMPEIKVRATRDSGKLDLLIQKLKEENVILEGKDNDEAKCALVFSQSIPMVEMVVEALNEAGVKAAMITGDTKAKDRNRIKEEFQAQGPDAPRVIVANTKAGGASLTLTQADTVHILDETWNPDDQEQASDRAHRGDDLTMGKDEVRIYFYRTRNTVEEYIQKLVADKELNNKTILDLRRRMQKELAAAEDAERGEG